MDINPVGRSGLQVSALGLGCNNFGMRIGEEESAKVVQASLDAGITFFDTSDSYGGSLSEQYLGAALVGHRDEVVIATKFASKLKDGPYQGGASRKYIMTACDASLRRLGTDYIDLYYQHWLDPKTPVEETLDALDDLVRAGKVRYAACSNYTGWRMVEAEYVARERHEGRFVACQAEWSLLQRKIEAELVPACAAYGVGIIPYFPLASGLLTGKYTRGEAPAPDTRLGSSDYFASMATDEAFDLVDRLTAVGKTIGHSLLEMAIGWLLHQPVVPSVLVGATRPEQVASNAAAAEVKFTPDEVEAIGNA